MVRLTNDPRRPQFARGAHNESCASWPSWTSPGLTTVARQNRYAIYYYGKVEPRPDRVAGGALRVRLGQLPHRPLRAGARQPRHPGRPFFMDEYFPEALLLKAVIYYENCRYREAPAILHEFERTYKPVYNELEKITAKNTTPRATTTSSPRSRSCNKEGVPGGALLLERILKLALTDKDLKVHQRIHPGDRTGSGRDQEKGDVFSTSGLARTSARRGKPRRRS